MQISPLRILPKLRRLGIAPTCRATALLTSLGLLTLGAGTARASVAYGSINNFDTVNDTGQECHGFEIELDDIHSTGISYTYDWNHYGTPKISEDNTDPAHPKVHVRYESGKTATGAWAAFTAIPSAPIAPTMGHQFTNPSVNFGGEHFGVGYAGVPSNIKYNWLIDDGSGNLVLGPAVSVATPVFTYIAPAVVGAAPQVQAAIIAPPPPVPPPVVMEFGHASWVKEIRTTTHNSNEVKLRDLVSHDDAFPNVKNWANGEPAEVESEWQLMQTDSGAADGGANKELKGAPEALNKGDEVITRRYECYEYVGPLDPETGEALTDTVGADGIHGTTGSGNGGNGTDYSKTVIVGKFLGAQMSAADLSAPVGLVDHLQDGEVDAAYPGRTVVIAGGSVFTSTLTGALPPGLAFDVVTGILSGTPTTAGKFTFTITAQDGVNPAVNQTYIVSIAAAGAVLPPHSSIAATVLPAASGTVLGTGDLPNGQNVTVTALPKAGFAFLNWTEAGVILSTSPAYTFKVDANHALVANFIPSGAKVAQAITFPMVATQRYNDGHVALGATASSGLGVHYTVLSGPGTINGTMLNFTGVGTVKVQASQAGSSAYLAAPSVTGTVLIRQGVQTITQPKIAPQMLADGSVTLNATASSGLPVTYAVLSGPATAAGNVVSFSGAGTVKVLISQTGSALYAARTLTVSFVVNKAVQTITFPKVANQLLSGGAFSVTATSSSGLPVSFSLVSGPATVVGNVVKPTGVGTVKLSATQAGNDAFAAAKAVTLNIAIK